MKRLITSLAATVMVSCAPVQAADFWSGLMTGITFSALLMQPQHEPEWQRQQREEMNAVGAGNAQTIVILPQKAYDYTRITPQEEPRTQYLKDCQRYGFTLRKCQLMWDGPEIEEEVSVAKKQQNRY
jgi:hypothetical protein